MPPMDVLHADYVIAGAGASGLLLADAILREPALNDKTLLLLDRAPKTTNDRTWCFWERGDNPLEDVIHRRWSKLGVFGDGVARVFDPVPYRYKMLRGIDFYQHMDARVGDASRVTRLYGQISDLRQGADSASVTIDGRTLTGRFVFNSLPPPLPDGAQHHNLLQHFMGWVIETEDDRFDPDVATLMDFRIAQPDGTRFVYVLPLDARRALVEFTVFSGALLERAEYVRALRDYIEGTLKIDEFRIAHDEFGVIPMTDAPYPRGGGSVMNIGTAGGATKPSTGYTFLRAQRQARKIAAQLAATGDPFYAEPIAERRFKVFDSTLLNVLDKNRQGGAAVFANLFEHNPPALIFKFLDEDTTLAEDLRVMASVDIPVFTKALLAVTAGRAVAAR
jgi:lycopene beta-cyclase